MGRRLTVTDAPYPSFEQLVDPYGFRHMTDAELRESMQVAVLRLQEAMDRHDGPIPPGIKADLGAALEMIDG